MADWQVIKEGDLFGESVSLVMDSYEGTYALKLSSDVTSPYYKGSLLMRRLNFTVDQVRIATWGKGESDDLYGWFVVRHPSYGMVKVKRLYNWTNWENWRVTMYYDERLDFRMVDIEKWNPDTKEWVLVDTYSVGTGAPALGDVDIGIRIEAVGRKTLWLDVTSGYAVPTE